MGDQVIMTNQARKLGGQTSVFIVDFVDVVVMVVVCHGRVGTCHPEQELVQHKKARHKIKNRESEMMHGWQHHRRKNLCKLLFLSEIFLLVCAPSPCFRDKVAKKLLALHSVFCPSPHLRPSCSSFSLRVSEDFDLFNLLCLLSHFYYRILCLCGPALFRGHPSRQQFMQGTAIVHGLLCPLSMCARGKTTTTSLTKKSSNVEGNIHNKENSGLVSRSMMTVKKVWRNSVEGREGQISYVRAMRD